MAAAAAPLIGGGVSLLGKLFGGGSNPATPAMGNVSNQAGFLSGVGNPLLSKASSYYQTLLGNSRSGIQTLLAPETNQIADTYRGAKAGLAQSGMRGGAKDMATANLNRDEAGAVAGLAPAAKASALSGAQGLGLGASQGAQQGYASLLGPAESQYQFGVKESDLTGQGLGSFFAQLLQSFGKGGGGLNTTPVP